MSDCLTPEFEYGLKQLDMLEPDYPGSSGLVLVGQSPPNHHEYISLEKAGEYGVDAVYFRRFGNGRASIPQIYLYDFTQNKKNEDEIGELHRKLWNSGRVPLFFIFTKTEIKIFNCLKPPEYDEENERIISSPMVIIYLAAVVQRELDKLKEFSARQFDNGAFWESSSYKDKFKLNESSYETLLDHLKEKRDAILRQKILDKPIIDKLLMMSILVKYLEERKDREGKSVFPPDFFTRFADGAKRFTDVFKKKGACLGLFDYLSKHFNGEIFKWKDANEQNQLRQTDLTPFVDFFEARTRPSGQKTLWPLYSFNDLPIELISNIYEEFLGGNNKGVVYTPPYLVHFLVDETMPLAEPKINFKILDPACGSGVFLVGVYKRLIDWWRIQHNWETPGLYSLKLLLKENIYGVDVEEEAVQLATFSLSLALLDELSPRVIWEELKFDDLKNKNLFVEDFFKLIYSKQLTGTFDLVIGNPPFIEKFTTPSAVEIEAGQKKKRFQIIHEAEQKKQFQILTEIAKKRKHVQIPNNQLALLFLEQAMAVCKPKGLVCLIMPAGPFLYNNDSSCFRSYYFLTYHVKQILDFTALSEVLFSSANVATLCIFAKKEEPESKNNVLHVTFRRTKASKEKLYFELDHYDFHYISYRDALSDKWIWKANFLGGGRLHHLISTLSNLRKLGDYLDEKERNEGWVIKEGFILSDSKDVERFESLENRIGSLSKQELAEYEKLKKVCQKADYLTGKKTLPTDAFTEKGIDESQINILHETYFLRPRKEKIYEGPHILIKELIGRFSIPIAFRKEFLSFKNSIIGIHAPENQADELKKLEKRIKHSRVYLFFAAAHSGRYMINKATSLLKGDIENLPYPENEKELKLPDIEEILVDDVLEYMLDFRRRGEKSNALKPVKPQHLLQFAEIYCSILNSVYKEFKPSDPIVLDSSICFPFYYSKKPLILGGDKDKLESHMRLLVHKKVGENLRITRILRIYDENIIYLVKPKQVRYWLRSVAIRDADDTFADLVKQGY